ncbi:hypothetical protein HID58_044507 [Brassica napus]|uniref:Secretory carrier membrane protein n=1 Tax=Brassica napus TaxID=3708 RepID=A0ABQ8BJK5_BRANA|nr:hypothetical protein HID58_044507 [Brassica napus]
MIAFVLNFGYALPGSLLCIWITFSAVKVYWCMLVDTLV